MSATTPPRLKWSRQRDPETGSTSYWASTGKRYHSLCFAIWYTPASRHRARAHVELTAWVGPDDTPVVERSEAFTGDLAAFRRALPSLQRALICETAERLEAAAAAVFALRRCVTQ